MELDNIEKLIQPINIMATLFTHCFVGFTLAQVLPIQNRDKKFVTTMTLLPIIPDLDYIGFALKVPYESFWGHRGFTHSILFCLFLALFLSFFFDQLQSFKTKVSHFICFYISLFSHPLLDAFTNGGLGVAFYSPYSLYRYFFPYHPIQVSPMGLSFFSERGVMVLLSESYWVALPCLILLVCNHLVRKKYAKNSAL
jgi:inner membrane protein